MAIRDFISLNHMWYLGFVSELGGRDRLNGWECMWNKISHELIVIEAGWKGVHYTVLPTFEVFWKAGFTF